MQGAEVQLTDISHQGFLLTDLRDQSFPGLPGDASSNELHTASNDRVFKYHYSYHSSEFLSRQAAPITSRIINTKYQHQGENKRGQYSKHLALNPKLFNHVGGCQN